MTSLLRSGARLFGLHRTIQCNLNPTLPFEITYHQLRHAGHAKWQNIKGTKEANDLAKARRISRYVLMVRRAIIAGNMQADPRLNTKLGDVLSEAAKFNVPKATLERAITRSMNLKILSFNLEVQGPGKCSMIIRCEAENANYLRRDVKKVLKKYDSNLMPENSLINMFYSRGFIRASVKTKDDRDIDFDTAEEAAIISNAEEVNLEGQDDVEDLKLSKMYLFETDANNLNSCKGELEKLGFVILSSDLELVPYRSVDFGLDVYDKALELEKDLKELEQVIEVYHNIVPPRIE